MSFEIIESDGKPIKAWTRGVQVEEAAKQQLRNLASLPFIHKHVAAMPDVHWGMGVTVGSVIATKGAIIPAAVGVDIGCGMAAQRTPLTAADLPDNLLGLRTMIEAAIPHGRTNNGAPGDRGAWGSIQVQTSIRNWRARRRGPVFTRARWAPAITSSNCAWMKSSAYGSCCIQDPAA